MMTHLSRAQARGDEQIASFSRSSSSRRSRVLRVRSGDGGLQALVRIVHFSLLSRRGNGQRAWRRPDALAQIMIGHDARHHGLADPDSTDADAWSWRPLVKSRYCAVRSTVPARGLSKISHFLRPDRHARISSPSYEATSMCWAFTAPKQAQNDSHPGWPGAK